MFECVPMPMKVNVECVVSLLHRLTCQALHPGSVGYPQVIVNDGEDVAQQRVGVLGAERGDALPGPLCAAPAGEVTAEQGERDLGDPGQQSMSGGRPCQHQLFHLTQGLVQGGQELARLFSMRGHSHN